MFHFKNILLKVRHRNPYHLTFNYFIDQAHVEFHANLKFSAGRAKIIYRSSISHSLSTNLLKKLDINFIIFNTPYNKKWKTFLNLKTDLIFIKIHT
jgi:hypothetical protein